MKLVIVESPAKARTIKKFLSSGYRVVSSMGHVRDLPEKRLGVDLENNFAPRYEILRKKKLKVKIPAGTTENTRIRLKGMGAKSGDLNGDLYLTVKIKE